MIHQRSTALELSENILLEGLNQFHLNNFQNALPSDFEILRIKVQIFCILSKLTKVSICVLEHKQNLLFFFAGEISPFWHNSGAVSTNA